jgi:hypothetical protein
VQKRLVAHRETSALILRSSSMECCMYCSNSKALLQMGGFDCVVARRLRAGQGPSIKRGAKSAR